MGDLAVIEGEIAPYLFNLDKVTEPKCKLCKSKRRDEAEEMFDGQIRRKNYSELQRRIESELEIEVSIPAVRNHMLYHYNTVKRNASINEYSRDLKQWVAKQSNKVVAIKSRIAVLDREMMSLAEKGEELDLEARHKNADILKKLSECIILHEKQLKEHQEEVEPMKLVFNQLAIVINEEIEHGNNAQIRKVLANVLTKLQNSVGDIII